MPVRSPAHFASDDFDGFDRGHRLDLTYVCFTEYDETIPNKEVAFHKVEITNTFENFSRTSYDSGENRRD